ncbi:tRNA lysidine(34) synthetase TilS [Candidatus Peregrinibacteria bacterium]|nr:MAG: tRNA lysidine(34) synthetase TilS [Candidatus Peregrinibacteria bacterium]
MQQLLEQLGPIRRLVVGVSGGVDSVVLAHQLHALGYELIIAHLNHGLRGEASDADALFVRQFAKELNVPCVIDRQAISLIGNVEQNARTVRYRFLEDVRKQMKADLIAVAHHLDDPIETVLMHLLRGAGLRGARGMLVQQERLIRPL